MDEPLITVVIATYNRAALLSRAIRSVMGQTYRRVIVAVYDNASTDETASMVAELARADSRIAYHRHESNIGGGQNFLFGLRRVATPFFCMLSDDDLMLPNFLADAASWLERFPAARFAAGGTLEMTESASLVFAPQCYWPREGYFEPPDGLDLMLTGFHPSWTTIVFRREVLREVGEFNVDLPNVGDLDFTLHVAARYPFVVFRKPSGIFVRHVASGGEYTNVSVMDQFETMTRGLVAIDGIADEAKALIKTRLTEAMYKRILQVAVKQLLRTEPKQALETLRTYHRRYSRTIASTAIEAVAAGGAVCPPLLRALHPADAVRRAVLARRGRTSARANGLEAIDETKYAPFLEAGRV